MGSYINNLKLKYMLIILSLLIVISCKSKTNQVYIDNISKIQNSIIQNKDLGVEEEEYYKEKSLKNNNYEKINYDKGEKVLIVMVYGLTFTRSHTLSKLPFQIIQKRLEKYYPNSDLGFLIIHFDKPLSMSMCEQGQSIYEQINKYFKSNEHMRGSRIIFIGQCTGAIAAYETYKKPTNNQKIVGIISAGAPWQGAEITVSRHKELSWFFYLTFGLPIMLFYGNNKPPIKEMIPGSDYIKGLQDSLANNKLPIWAIGGKSKYFKEFLKTKFGKIFIRKNTSEEKIFGSEEHDGVVGLDSQIGTKYPKIKSIILNEPSNHTTGNKIVMNHGLTKIIKIFGPAISKEDKEKLLLIRKEPSILQTNNCVCLINKFVEKYGLYPYKNYPDDFAIINKCNKVCSVTKEQIAIRERI